MKNHFLYDPNLDMILCCGEKEVLEQHKIRLEKFVKDMIDGKIPLYQHMTVDDECGDSFFVSFAKPLNKTFFILREVPFMR